MENNESISALIVDDDLLSRELLNDLLKKHLPQVIIKELCDSAATGIRAVTQWQPDIIFLDVEMPGMNGFEMLQQLPPLRSEVIFITAHDQYAINAIRVSALDYLLKPVQPLMLQQAVNRAAKKIREKKLVGQSRSSSQSVDSAKENQVNNLAIPTMEGLLFVKLAHIIRCESDGKYTKIFTVGKKMVLASRILGEFEDMLHTSGFIRIHKSHLINANYLKKYIRGEGGQVIMADGSTLPVARRKKEELLQIVSQFQ